MRTENFIQDALNQSQEILNKFSSDQQNTKLIQSAISLMTDSLQAGGKIMSCGNGGSMCDSLHLVEELTGRYCQDRPPIAAIGMGDGGHMTCVGNDFGFEYIFSRCVEAWGKTEDCLLAISTSGNSANVIKAVEMANQKKIKSIGLLGKDGGKLKDLVTCPIIVPAKATERVQEIHIKIIHIFIEGIERTLYPQLYR